MRPLLLFSLWVVASGCQPPDPDEAIEITGYLDAERITWTVWDDVVQAAGKDGATDPAAVLTLVNRTSGDEAETKASALGAFSVSVRGSAGDSLELVLRNGPEGHEVPHDVPDDRLPFPDTTSVIAVADAHQPGLVVVELGFEPPLTGGHVWVANHSTEGSVTLLDVFNEGAFHGGHLDGVVDDLLLAWWVPEGGPESLPLEMIVHESLP